MGIVFVMERVIILVFLYVFLVYFVFEFCYFVEFMVGILKFFGGKYSFFDFIMKEDIEFLYWFRKGKVNLLVVISVFEEGIDVFVCNLVICFDKFSNFKLFI